MSESASSLMVSDSPRMMPFARLDVILASTEQALARAEASLRKTQQARVRSTSPVRLDSALLLRYREEYTRQ